MTQKIKKTILSISIHATIWLLILLFNFVFLRNNVINFDLRFHILTWIVYITFFYLNYLFLIPYFLLRKRILIFIFFALVSIGSAYFINEETAKYQSITVFRQDNLARQWLNPDPEQLKPTPPEFGDSSPLFNREVMKRAESGRMINDGSPFRHRPDLLRIIISVSGLLLLFFAGISVKVFLRFSDDEKKRDAMEKERIATELSYLKQQINPHFLFNTLNNIYALSLKSPELTQVALLKVSSILRYTLYKTDNLPASLQEEIEIINVYIEFQNMRLKNNLPVEFKLEGEVGSHKIEPFIILPLVENAFKYGMIDINDSFIRIHVTIKETLIQFYVENKKTGVIANDPEHSGIGLKNIQRRLYLVYPEDHLFRINDTEGTFSVFVELPLET